MYLTILQIENMLDLMYFEQPDIKRIMESCYTFTLGGIITSLRHNDIPFDCKDVDNMFDHILKMRGISND